MIRMDGSLTVKKINGRNGPFRVANLVVDIGEFKVKDPMLDQFEPGQYEVIAFVSEIYMGQYTSYGSLTTEMRARLSDLHVKAEREVMGDPPREPTEIDPLDELAPAPEPTRKSRVPKIDTPPAGGDKGPSADACDASAQAGTSTEQAADTSSTAGGPSVGDNHSALIDLFGEEIAALIEAGSTVRLDPTIDDRARFRAQTTRLRELGYRFDSKQQTWLPSAE